MICGVHENVSGCTDVLQLEMMDGDLVEVFYEVLGGEMRLLR